MKNYFSRKIVYRNLLEKKPLSYIPRLLRNRISMRSADQHALTYMGFLECQAAFYANTSAQRYGAPRHVDDVRKITWRGARRLGTGQMSFW